MHFTSKIGMIKHLFITRDSYCIQVICLKSKVTVLNTAL